MARKYAVTFPVLTEVIRLLAMDTREVYMGCAIQANPTELADGSGWTEDYNIEVPHEDRTDVTRYFFGRKCPTRAEAIAACISEGRRKIDRLLKDTAAPENLKATWDEKQTLRPALQGPIDPLIGEGILRHAKDKRSRTLDDLDGEPE